MDGDSVGRGRESESSTAETVRKRPERPWTTARTMEVLRRCPLAIAQRLVHCATAVSTAVLDRVTKTMSVAPLLTNNLDNLKQKTSNLLSPAPPPYTHDLFWAKLRVQLHLPLLRSLDLLISPGTLLNVQTRNVLNTHCSAGLCQGEGRNKARLQQGNAATRPPNLSLALP